MADPVATHGWTALPRDTSLLLNGRKNVRGPEPVTVNSVPLPDTPLAKKVLEYAQKELREETFNHSMRVFYYGMTTPTIPLSSMSPYVCVGLRLFEVADILRSN